MHRQKSDILSTPPCGGVNGETIQITSMGCMLHFSQYKAHKFPNLRNHYTHKVFPIDISFTRIYLKDECAQQWA